MNEQRRIENKIAAILEPDPPNASAYYAELMNEDGLVACQQVYSPKGLYALMTYFNAPAKWQARFFFTDLLAMHAAELALSAALREDYASWLDTLANQDIRRIVQDIEHGEPSYQYENCRTNWAAVYTVITAPAEQRAEALRMTLRIEESN